MSQRTFSIIKPDAVRKGHTTAILAAIEKAGFKIVSIKKASISKAQAEGFYHVHAARPFFGELTEFMSSGAIFPMALEKDNAIADGRDQPGAGGRGNDPQAVRRVDRRERHSWLRRRGHRSVRDRLLLRGLGT